MKRSKSFNIQRKKKQPAKPIKVERQFKSLQKQGGKAVRQGVSVPERIKKYIQKRSDVEMIAYYNQYKQQFFLKCKRLHEYLYKFPLIRQKYLNDENPHFRYSFQFLLLDLFRKGVIPPDSYDNLRIEAVQEIQNWVLSWIQRNLLYEKLKQQEKSQIIKSLEVLSELEQYVKIIEVEQLPF